MILFKFICIMLLIDLCLSKTSSKVLEGYPAGYLSNCPGSNKEAKLSRATLKELKLVHYTGADVISSFVNKTSYNYYQMKSLTKHLDYTKKTVVYANGYLDSNFLSLTSAAIGSLYKKLGYNVFGLEYVSFSAMVYPRAVRFLRPVGKHAAEMLAELTQYGLDPKKLEIIGLSHGGQAISFIAKNYRQITGMNISRVTALDPSGACFRNKGPEERIDASDADFVEVIHTNIDGYGIAAPVGHIDFYVNGGEYQPGPFESLPCTNLCSHVRSYTLWIGALQNHGSLIGMQCDSIQDARNRNCFDRKPFVTNVMGLNTDKSKQGIFYVMSSNVFPYGMGKRGLKKEFEVFNKVIGSYNEPDVIEI